MRTKNQRISAFIACFAVIVTALFSALFIAKEAGHDCTGEDCPVCTYIHQAEQTLKRLGTGGTEKTAVSPYFYFVTAAVLVTVPFFPCVSLISRKVRLDN